MDNCVLDNNLAADRVHYDHWHPGGKFTLTKNFGRDISKYFYGAYKLVNTEKEILKCHSHSATQIANNMIIANLAG